MIYWTPENQLCIEQYVNTKTKEERNELFSNCLYDSILINCKQVLYNYNNVNEDDLQDLLIFVSEKVLPKIKQEKIQASQQLIWVSINRRVISTFHSTKSKNKVSYESDTTSFDRYSTPDITTDVEYNYIVKEDKEELRKEILKVIDQRIEQERIINKSKTIFLILLKEHLIENDFETTTFKDECIKRMNLKHKGSFNNIASSLNIRTRVFKEDKLN